MPFGTWRPSRRFRVLNCRKTIFFALTFTMLSQAGCGYSPFGNDKASPKKQTTPQQTTQNSVGSLDPRDLAAPPSPGENISVDAPAAILNAPNTGPPDPLTQIGSFEPKPGGMLGTLGFNLDTYFAQDIQDPITRIKRLERAVVAIQKDLKTVAPPIQRLVAVEGDISELVGQLEVLLEEEQIQPAAMAPQNLSPPVLSTPTTYTPPSPAPAPVYQEQPAPQTVQAPAPAAAPAPAPMAAASGPTVTAVRLGQHSDKTRIVLDVTGNTSYSADLDNNEKLLIIELQDAAWSAPSTQTFSKSPPIKGYKVEPGNGGKGSLLVVQLTQGSDIVYQSKLQDPGGRTRIVVDLKK